ncbi:unnamed protein product [Amoebophrya sp. A25]|nr:unnamed protein product [Amoebophrya sp. A25]|eukprot:GSA25T00010846001.1
MVVPRGSPAKTALSLADTSPAKHGESIDITFSGAAISAGASAVPGSNYCDAEDPFGLSPSVQKGSSASVIPRLALEVKQKHGHGHLGNYPQGSSTCRTSFSTTTGTTTAATSSVCTSANSTSRGRTASSSEPSGPRGQQVATVEVDVVVEPPDTARFGCGDRDAEEDDEFCIQNRNVRDMTDESEENSASSPLWSSSYDDHSAREERGRASRSSSTTEDIKVKLLQGTTTGVRVREGDEDDDAPARAPSMNKSSFISKGRNSIMIAQEDHVDATSLQQQQSSIAASDNSVEDEKHCGDANRSTSRVRSLVAKFSGVRNSPLKRLSPVKMATLGTERRKWQDHYLLRVKQDKNSTAGTRTADPPTFLEREDDDVADHSDSAVIATTRRLIAGTQSAEFPPGFFARGGRDEESGRGSKSEVQEPSDFGLDDDGVGQAGEQASEEAANDAGREVAQCVSNYISDDRTSIIRNSLKLICDLREKIKGTSEAGASTALLGGATTSKESRTGATDMSTIANNKSASANSNSTTFATASCPTTSSTSCTTTRTSRGRKQRAWTTTALEEEVSSTSATARACGKTKHISTSVLERGAEVLDRKQKLQNPRQNQGGEAGGGTCSTPTGGAGSNVSSSMLRENKQGSKSTTVEVSGHASVPVTGHQARTVRAASTRLTPNKAPGGRKKKFSPTKRSPNKKEKYSPHKKLAAGASSPAKTPGSRSSRRKNPFLVPASSRASGTGSLDTSFSAGNLQEHGGQSSEQPSASSAAIVNEPIPLASEQEGGSSSSSSSSGASNKLSMTLRNLHTEMQGRVRSMLGQYSPKRVSPKKNGKSPWRKRGAASRLAGQKNSNCSASTTPSTSCKSNHYNERTSGTGTPKMISVPDKSVLAERADGDNNHGESALGRLGADVGGNDGGVNTRMAQEADKGEADNGPSVGGSHLGPGKSCALARNCSARRSSSKKGEKRPAASHQAEPEAENPSETTRTAPSKAASKTSMMSIDFDDPEIEKTAGDVPESSSSSKRTSSAALPQTNVLLGTPREYFRPREYRPVLEQRKRLSEEFSYGSPESKAVSPDLIADDSKLSSKDAVYEDADENSHAFGDKDGDTDSTSSKGRLSAPGAESSANRRSTPTSLRNRRDHKLEQQQVGLGAADERGRSSDGGAGGDHSEKMEGHTREEDTRHDREGPRVMSSQSRRFARSVSRRREDSTTGGGHDETWLSVNSEADESLEARSLSRPRTAANRSHPSSITIRKHSQVVSGDAKFFMDQDCKDRVDDNGGDNNKQVVHVQDNVDASDAKVTSSRQRERTPVRALQEFWNSRVQEISEQQMADRSRQRDLVQRGKERASSVLEQIEQRRSQSSRARNSTADDIDDELTPAANENRQSAEWKFGMSKRGAGKDDSRASVQEAQSTRESAAAPSSQKQGVRGSATSQTRGGEPDNKTASGATARDSTRALSSRPKTAVINGESASMSSRPSSRVVSSNKAGGRASPQEMPRRSKSAVLQEPVLHTSNSRAGAPRFGHSMHQEGAQSAKAATSAGPRGHVSKNKTVTTTPAASTSSAGGSTSTGSFHRSVTKGESASGVSYSNSTPATSSSTYGRSASTKPVVQQPSSRTRGAQSGSSSGTGTTSVKTKKFAPLQPSSRSRSRTPTGASATGSASSSSASVAMVNTGSSAGPPGQRSVMAPGSSKVQLQPGSRTVAAPGPPGARNSVPVAVESAGTPRPTPEFVTRGSMAEASSVATASPATLVTTIRSEGCVSFSDRQRQDPSRTQPSSEVSSSANTTQILASCHASPVQEQPHRPVAGEVAIASLTSQSQKGGAQPRQEEDVGISNLPYRPISPTANQNYSSGDGSASSSRAVMNFPSTNTSAVSPGTQHAGTASAASPAGTTAAPVVATRIVSGTAAARAFDQSTAMPPAFTSSSSVGGRFVAPMKSPGTIVGSAPSPLMPTETRREGHRSVGAAPLSQRHTASMAMQQGALSAAGAATAPTFCPAPRIAVPQLTSAFQLGSGYSSVPAFCSAPQLFAASTSSSSSLLQPTPLGRSPATMQRSATPTSGLIHPGDRDARSTPFIGGAAFSAGTTNTSSSSSTSSTTGGTTSTILSYKSPQVIQHQQLNYGLPSLQHQATTSCRSSGAPSPLISPLQPRTPQQTQRFEGANNFTLKCPQSPPKQSGNAGATTSASSTGPRPPPPSSTMVGSAASSTGGGPRVSTNSSSSTSKTTISTSKSNSKVENASMNIGHGFSTSSNATTRSVTPPAPGRSLQQHIQHGIRQSTALMKNTPTITPIANTKSPLVTPAKKSSSALLPGARGVVAGSSSASASSQHQATFSKQASASASSQHQAAFSGVFPSPTESSIQIEIQGAQSSPSGEGSSSNSASVSASVPTPGVDALANARLDGLTAGLLNDYRSPNSIKDFEIMDLIGKGTSGELYRVRPKASFRQSPAFVKPNPFSGSPGPAELPSFYALKIIRKSKVKQLKMQDFLLREIEIHSTLNHPNVLRFYDYFTDSRKIYLLLELCRSDLYALMKAGTTSNNATTATGGSSSVVGAGAVTANQIASSGSTAETKAQGRFSEAQAAEYMHQICTGFAYLHQNKVLHGDIKLENILIGMDGLVKIADFGTVCKSQTLKRSTFCGTLDYLAPEIVERGEKEYAGDRTDVWALGIMLFELITGKPPFEDEDTYKTCRRILKREPVFPTDMTSECSDLIRRMLQKNPNQRCNLAGVRSSAFFRKHGLG